MDAFLETLKNLGPARLGVMLLTLLGLVVFFIYIAVRSGTPSMTLLYGNLSTADATAVVAKLEISDIPYRMGDNGTEVMVPQQHVGMARMLLAAEGLPSTGTIGYEVFDQKQRFGTTSFVQNINQLRALEGELARTIRTLDQVQTARVHLVLPQRELFTRESRAASASVTLSLRGSRQITPEQVQAVQHLVASAVPELKAEHVAITDTQANLLAGGERDTGLLGGRGGSPEDKKVKYEQHLTSVIEDLVSRVVGYGKVRANVVAEIDFDVVSRNSETFDPEGQVLRSSQNISDEEKDTTGSNSQAVTVENNLPGLPGVGGNGGGLSRTRTEDIANYEISRTVESVMREGGEIRKLSVAVLVDGNYETLPPAEGAEETEAAPARSYSPRSQEELDKIASLVQSAVGYDSARGDVVQVVNMQFANTEDLSPMAEEELVFGLLERQDLLRLAEILMLGLVSLLVVFVVLRPLVNHFAAAAQSAAADRRAAMEAPRGGAAGMPQMDAAGMQVAGLMEEGEDNIDMVNVEGRINASSMRKISDIVETHPSEAVSVLRSWMSQES
ncbi:MAG: flagellar M-ring protein FliF [Alphaproteobacteria bacterium]|nr:MAG: flagellar M-ring protein FliF [Alphaproteobacteria bacterium]